jgi:GT2 family glycosyltransferase
MDLSIVIVTYNSAGCIRDCLESIERTTSGLAVEVLLVDNASSDDTLRIVQEVRSRAVVIRNAVNAGFPAANNQAIALARGRYVVLLNPDTVVTSGAFEALLQFMDAHPACGVCGPTLVCGDGTEQPDLHLPSFLSMTRQLLAVLGVWHPQTRLHDDQVEAVSGACLMFRAELRSSVGLLDPALFWCEDMDYCVRVQQAGYRVQPVRAARVVHLEGQSAASNLALKMYVINASLIGFAQKHAGPIDRWLMIGLVVIQVAARATLWSIRVRTGRSRQATDRRDGLVRVLRELPALLDRRQRLGSSGRRT